MARKFLTKIDLNQNELLNAVVQVLPTSSAPSPAAEGQIYYDSTLDRLRVYDGSAWVTMDPATVISFGTPGSSAVGDAAAAGSASTSARSDHVHGREGFGTPGTSGVGDSASSGAATTISRSDHTHGRESFGTSASTQAIGDSQSAGSASTPSRSDHKHAMPAFGSVSAQSSFGASSANGTASTVARSDHTHGTPTHDAAAHSGIKLSDLAVPTSDVSFGSQKITNLAEPASASDAATKGYVDGAIEGLSWKDSVRVATTTAGTLASSFENGDTVDGVTLATGDRILIKDQGTGSENGIYVVAASGAPTRAADASTAAELRGAAVFVEQGTANANKQYVLTTDSITLGSTALDFVVFGGGTSYSAGDGLTLDGSTFNVGAGTGISVGADSVAIDTSIVGRYKSFTITGNGSQVNFDLTHSLQQFVSVQVVDGDSPYDQVECDVERTSSTACRVKFATAPANLKTYKVIVVG